MIKPVKLQESRNAEISKNKENSLYLFDEVYRSEYGVIAGLDEAGRGPLAGPLVASAVILPPTFTNSELNDSKKLTDKVRRKLFPIIKKEAIAYSYGIVSAAEIDKNRMAWAVRASFNRSIQPLLKEADVFLIDGNSVTNLKAPARFIVKGDQKSLSIAASSVLAKVTRDDLMVKAHEKYPEYGFDRHKGYGTKAHIQTIREKGPCSIHRMSFNPLRSWYQTGQLSLFPDFEHNKGKAAENLTELYYKKLGYRILARNWSCASGEIDLIVQKDDQIVFVEVKSSYSGNFEQAIRRIDIRKLSRIRNAAAEWILIEKASASFCFEAAIVTRGCVSTIPIETSP